MQEKDCKQPGKPNPEPKAEGKGKQDPTKENCNAGKNKKIKKWSIAATKSVDCNVEKRNLGDVESHDEVERENVFIAANVDTPVKKRKQDLYIFTAAHYRSKFTFSIMDASHAPNK